MENCPMRVAVVHQDVAEGASLDEQDTRLQGDAVESILRGLGHETVRLGTSLDLAKLEAELKAARPDAVFNLVESLGGSDRLLFLAAAIYDSLGIPYTGSPTEALVVTSHKLMAKRQMLLADLPTAEWCASDDRATGEAPPLLFPGRYIFKCVFEHGSWGMDEDAVLEMRDERQLRREVRRRQEASKRVCFAERYIEGREFNVALVEGPDGPRVLPIGEINFDNYPGDKPKIVCYQAKWAEESFEYINTPRHFGYTKADDGLIEELTELSLRCWRHFDLRGYARVDFRVDEAGRPWILEINANPCLTPEAGFWAMLGQAKIPYEQAIAAILESALPHAGLAEAKPVTTPRRAATVKISPIRKERRRGPALAPRTGSE